MTVSDRSRALLAAWLAALVLLPARARAQSPGEAGTVAEALFRDGVALFEAGNVHEACGKFAESFRIDPANGTLQNLAVCHEREGKIASAWGELTQLAARAAAAGQRERERMARAHAAELEPRVPKVTLVLGPRLTVEHVVVDGHELGRDGWTSPLPLDPGDHVFTFRGVGGASATHDVRIEREGEMVAIDVPDLAPPPPRSDGRRTAAFASAGVAVVALGLGGYFGLATITAKNDGDAHCDGRFCDAQGLSLQDDAHRDATISTIAFGVGLAAAAVAVYLWVTSPRGAAPVPRDAARAVIRW